jgi:hypothetical protein
MDHLPITVRVVGLCCPACEIIEPLSRTRWHSGIGFGCEVIEIHFQDVKVDWSSHTYDDLSSHHIAAKIQAALRLENELRERGGRITPTNWINGLIDWANDWGSCWCEGSFTRCGSYAWATGDWDVGDRCRHGRGASSYEDGLHQTRLYKDDQGMLAVRL